MGRQKLLLKKYSALQINKITLLDSFVGKNLKIQLITLLERARYSFIHLFICVGDNFEGQLTAADVSQQVKLARTVS